MVNDSTAQCNQEQVNFQTNHPHSAARMPAPPHLTLSAEVAFRMKLEFAAVEQVPRLSVVDTDAESVEEEAEGVEGHSGTMERKPEGAEKEADSMVRKAMGLEEQAGTLERTAEEEEENADSMVRRAEGEAENADMMVRMAMGLEEKARMWERTAKGEPEKADRMAHRELGLEAQDRRIEREAEGSHRSRSRYQTKYYLLDSFLAGGTEIVITEDYGMVIHPN